MATIRKEVKYGIFALGVIALIAAGVIYFKGYKFWKDQLVLYAEYTNVQGLEVGNPITIKGLKVGQVKAFNLDLTSSGQRVKVTLTFDESLKIPDNALAMIASSDLLGAKEIRIILDSLQSTTHFRYGDTIRGTTEQGILDVAEDLVETRGTQILLQVGQMATELNRILRVLGKALEDPRGRNAVTLILQDFQASSRNIANLTARFDSVAGTFKNIATKADSIMTNVERESENIPIILSNLRTTTDSLRTASGEIKQVITDASSAVSSVERLTSSMASTSGTLGLLINDTALYDSLTNTTENLNLLLRELKNNPHLFFDDIKLYLIERKPPKEKKKK